MTSSVDENLTQFRQLFYEALNEGNLNKLDLVYQGLNQNIFALNIVEFDPLYKAIKKNNIPMLDKLLSFGISPNTVAALPFEEALMTACKLNHLECVKSLLKYNVDLSPRTISNRSALVIALQNGALELAKLLVEHGSEYKEDYKILTSSKNPRVQFEKIKNEFDTFLKVYEEKKLLENQTSLQVANQKKIKI
jgi:ankyrin repeat protein